MKRLRWALARLFAPAPIMADRFGDEEGVFVYYRSAKRKYRLEWIVKAERFRLKSTNRLASLEYGKDAMVAGLLYRPNQPFTRFVGTLGTPYPLTSVLSDVHDGAQSAGVAPGHAAGPVA